MLTVQQNDCPRAWGQTQTDTNSLIVSDQQLSCYDMSRVALANKVNLILMTFHVEQISF